MNDTDVKDPNKTKAEEKRAMPQIQGSKPTEPWVVDVDVYLEDAGDPPQFRLESCLPMDSGEVITFHNRGRPGFTITFNLIDETGGGYRFPPNGKRHDALWSRQGPGCPPKDFGRQWDEFETVRVVEPDRTTLVVRNLNETVTEFGYTLRVTNDEGATFVDLDPVGNNQNGN